MATEKKNTILSTYRSRPACRNKKKTITEDTIFNATFMLSTCMINVSSESVLYILHIPTYIYMNLIILYREQ